MRLRRVGRLVLCGFAFSLYALPSAVGREAAAGSPPTPVDLAQPASAPTLQPASGPATQPTSGPSSAPAEAPNPLRSPAHMVEFFLAASAEGRTTDAQSCLNFSEVDEEVAKEKGPAYVSQLQQILERLRAAGHFEREKLPDDPAAPSQTIGKDPLLLVLERYELGKEQGKERRWQFSASTVADVPALYARLDELVSRVEAESAPSSESAATEEIQAPDEAASDPLRSPYHAVQHFLMSVANAREYTAAYVDAMECLDYSEVATEDVVARTDYVDNLDIILEHLRGSGEFEREKLPQQTESDTETLSISRDPFQIILVRQAGGRWRFAARSVARIPAMMEALQEQAEAKAAAGQSSAAAGAPPPLRLDASSPQATMYLFLTAMNEGDLELATTCLDLSGLNEVDRGGGKVLAGKLWMVLNRHRLIVLQDIPSEPDAAVPYAVLKHIAGRIEIDRQRGGKRNGEWLFTTATVRSIERLYEAFEKTPILPERRKARIRFWVLPSLYVREYVVPAVLKEPLGGLQAWQWMGILLVLLFGLLVRGLAGGVLPHIGRRLLETETTSVLPRTVRRALTPTTALALLLACWGGMQLLDLGAPIMGWVRRVLGIALVLTAVVAAYRLIDLFMLYYTARAAQRATRLDQVLVPLLEKALKVIIVVVGLLFVATALGVQIGPLLAGLGLGGLAFGLAAQDTLKNFFGLVNVVLDRPFQVGDWIKVGDLEGTVEKVGLRSSRVRTGHDSEVAIPNAELMNARIENLGRRRYRRMTCTLSVTYDTPPEKLEAFCEGVRELIRQHPYTRKDDYHVYVNALAASSIDILLYCFYQTPDWGTELRERQRLLLDIIRLAQRLAVEFAFTTQTVHLRQEVATAATAAADGAASATAAAAPCIGPAETDAALKLGREEAAAIVRAAPSDTVNSLPTVSF
jgi:MscS family membrane protein